MAPRQCDGCAGVIDGFDVVTSVPHQGREQYGHYHCIQRVVGPEAWLAALDQGLVAHIPQALFNGRRLAKHRGRVAGSRWAQEGAG